MSFVLKNVEIEYFNDVFSDMLNQFPKNELKGYDVYLNLLKSDNYLLFKAFDNNHEVGYSLIARDKVNNVIWLDYLAVHEKFHSKGYGGKILEALKDYFIEVRGCYLEVEKADENIPDTIRRIKFYENLGALRLNCDYYYPNKLGDLAMDMYFIPYHKDLPDCKTTISVISNIFELLHIDLNHIDQVLKKITVID